MIKEPLISSPQSCESSLALLARVTKLRDALDGIASCLQAKHLSCCVFPQLQVAGEVAGAIHQLSASRTGALIAIEREMSLEDYAKSSTLLNALVDTSLLQSLFYPGNRLHDGAVIIRRDTVLAAGCILPLSVDHTTFRIRGLGTRHRAGMGLSQVSDAIVFIVSEETGCISIALEGQLFHEPLTGGALTGIAFTDTVNRRPLDLELYDGVEETVIDLYSAVRNAHFQEQEAKIKD